MQGGGSSHWDGVIFCSPKGLWHLYCLSDVDQVELGWLPSSPSGQADFGLLTILSLTGTAGLDLWDASLVPASYKIQDKVTARGYTLSLLVTCLSVLGHGKEKTQ